MSITTMHDSMPGYSIRVRAPGGTLYVVVGEVDNKPAFIQINVGKSGANLAAWANGMASLITSMLERGWPLESIIANLSLNTSDKLTINDDGSKITSDIEGLVYALMRYKAQKYEEFSSEVKKLPGPRKGRINNPDRF